MPVEKIIKEEYIINDLSLSVRLDKYASEQLEFIPTKKCGYKLIKKGHLLLNGKQVSPEHKVSVGDKITLFEDVTDRPVFNLKLTVHFENEHCAVIEKLPGYPVMGNLYKSIENALPFNLKQSQCADKLSYPKPVHRLDSPTGGLLLIAKTASALRNLSRQFQVRNIKKGYHAIVSGQLPFNGEIKNSIEGRNAHTIYQRLECSRSLHTEWISMAKINLMTGRTHQIRRHMNSIGHPVVGDKLYAPNGTFRGKGLFLWATLLEFHGFEDDDVVRVEIAPPPKFFSYMRREQRRWEKYYSENV